jgi:putative flippase GtrA
VRRTGGKAARYLLTGSIAAVVDTGAFALLLPLALGVPVTATLSFLVASICNYLMSANFVFGAAHSVGGYFRFLAGAAVGLALNVGLTVWLAALLPRLVPLLLPESLSALLPDLAIVAKIIAIIVATAFNFTINLLIIFKPKN